MKHFIHSCFSKVVACVASCAVMLAPLAAVDVGQSADLGLGPVPASGGGGGATILSGDATGPATATVVAGLNGVPLGTGPGGASTGTGYVLVANGTSWNAVPVSADAVMNSAGGLVVKGLNGYSLGNSTPSAGTFLVGVGNGTCVWAPMTGDAYTIGGSSSGQVYLNNQPSTRSDLGLGTGNIPQFSGVTSTGLTLTQTLTASGASTLAGVACTSLVNSGTETVNTLSSTGAVTGGAGTFAGLTVEDPTTTSKTLTYNLAGASASTALTIASSQTANRTATIPVLAAADTFGMIGTAATWTGVQTLELPFITDSADTTKKIGFTISGQTTGTTLTINTGAQTASRQLNVPVLAGTDTIATLASAQTFSAAQAFSAAVSINTGPVTLSNAGGARISGTATTAQGIAGACGIYRVNGTLENIGSLVLQSDTGQSTGVVALYAGSVPQHCFTSGTSASTVYTGLADGNNITASFSTGGSATIAAAVMTEINTNTSTIATYYLWLPASPNNGQIVDFVSEGVISAITVSGNGHTIIGAPSAIAQYATYRWIYNTAATTWYREQ